MKTKTEKKKQSASLMAYRVTLDSDRKAEEN
jgi:hypothetical protein